MADETVLNKSHLEWALEYARRGWRVFPLFFVVKGGLCSCHSRKPCKRIGKHPMTKNGVQDATTDEATIRQWWTETPHANIGLATGQDGLVVMDIDDGPKRDKAGKEVGRKAGTESLKALVDANREKYGEFPETLAVQTGSGGRHYYMLSIHDIPNSQSKIAPDIDIRGAGGYVILPPSNHYSGGKYKWLNDLKMAGMVEWLENLCLTSKIDISGDKADEEADKDARRVNNEKRKFTPKQLVTLVNKIPADCDREVWWQVGAALKKELGDTEGFKVWTPGVRKHLTSMTRR